MTDTRSKIVGLAEQMVRTGGYNGFSFREIASEIGIKSSSVHYHFPSKEDLALAVADRYVGRFFDALGDPTPEGATVESQIALYCKVFQQSFADSQSACLCGMLSNETALLPDSVKQATIEFIERNVAWLEAVLRLDPSNFSEEEIRDRARLIYSALEGAMSVSALTQSSAWLDSISKVIYPLVV